MPQSQAIVALLMSIVVLVTAQSPPNLLDALVSSGASQFANFIQSDPETLQLYRSGRVQTVFAPSDSASNNSTLSGRAFSQGQKQQAALQCARGTTSLESASRSVPGSTLETNDEAPLLGGRGQRVVFDTRPPNSTSPAKRWASPIIARHGGYEATPLIKISSGLGKATNVIKWDIPYDGGIIHITDSYFTAPESLSSTSKATGQNSFSSQLAKSNSTERLEATHSVTVFLPSDEAFSATNTTIPASQLVSDHVVAGTVSYLPDLEDGSILTTQRGEILAVSIRSGRYYINGGQITKANLVLENGVAHVVNKVLKPKPAQTPVPAAASSNFMSVTGLFGVACYTVLMVMV